MLLSASSRPQGGRATLMSARLTVAMAAAVRDRGRSARVADTTIAGRVSFGTESACCAAAIAGTVSPHHTSHACRIPVNRLGRMPEKPVPLDAERREPHAEVDQLRLAFDVRPRQKAPEPGIVGIVPVIPHHPEAVGGNDQ